LLADLPGLPPPPRQKVPKVMKTSWLKYKVQNQGIQNKRVKIQDTDNKYVVGHPAGDSRKEAKSGAAGRRASWFLIEFLSLIVQGVSRGMGDFLGVARGERSTAGPSLRFRMTILKCELVS